MNKEQNNYINYRLQRATDTLNDAKLLAENERLINRTSSDK